MDLRDYLDILRARWRLIVATTLLGVLAAGIATLLTTPMYKATASVFVSTADGGTDVNQAYTGSLFTQQQVKSYVDVVSSTPVAQAVIDDLGLAMTPEALSGTISVNNPLDTVILEISATDPSPELAQLIANSATEQFAAQVTEMTAPLAGGDSLVKISTIQEASLPTSPYTPRTLINLALGFLVGLAVGVGAAVLLETLDTRIKTVESLQKHFDLPLLGVIAYDADAPKNPLIVHDQPSAKRSESFRQVRTNLQFVDVDHRPRSMVVTSSIPREGKTTTAINLALTLAQTGQPVFLLEADLRRPKVADYLGIEGNAGLTDVLVGRASLDDVLQPWGASGNLWVLASGPLPPNPSELLGSHAMAELLQHMETRATVIIDAPPLLPVTDAAVISQLAGGAIVVLAAHKTRREQLRTALSSLDAVGGRILGLVMNMASSKGPDAHRYGYSYGYEYSSNASRGRLRDAGPVTPVTGAAGANGSTPTQPVGAAPIASEPTGATPPTPRQPKSLAERLAARGAASRATAESGPDLAAEVAGERPAPVPPSEKARSGAPVAGAAAAGAGPVGSGALPVGQVGLGAPTASPPTAVPASAPATTDGTTTETIAAPLVRAGADPLRIPAPAPLPDTAVTPFDADPISPVEQWEPPAPRPAFDPLTAPLDEVRSQS